MYNKICNFYHETMPKKWWLHESLADLFTRVNICTRIFQINYWCLHISKYSTLLLQQYLSLYLSFFLLSIALFWRYRSFYLQSNCGLYQCLFSLLLSVEDITLSVIKFLLYKYPFTNQPFFSPLFFL